MATHLTDRPRQARPGRPPSPALLALFLLGALVTLGVILVVFPNLTGNLGYFALIVVTTLLSWGSLGLRFSGYRAVLPRAVPLVISVLLWLFVALDLVILALPLFISGGTANDADPFAGQGVVAAATPTGGVGLPGIGLAQATLSGNPATTPAAAGSSPTTAATAGAPAGNTATPATPARATGGAATPTAGATAGNTAARPTSPAASGAALMRSGDFKGAGNYKVSGKAILGKTPDGKTVLRFDNLNASNGPDLVVYLSREANPTNKDQVKNGVQLTRLKATQGSSNYEVDPSLDITQFKSAVIWCEAFSVLFGSASLS